MSPLRRTGLRLSAVALACWEVVVVAITTTDPADGVPIGAGFFYIVAVPLSATASLVLLGSLRTTAVGAGWPSRRKAKVTLRVAAAASAIATVVLLPVVLVGGVTDSMPANVLDGLLFSGLGAFVISTLLFGTMRP
ncbi:hypothetical protein [Geodermatophilus sp. DSM 44513]|uniref:hypothetical protein n=1 Tax=Geodermatophilus sp. DSM 44513 TaxID=1528104 RepID=UPI0028F73272|nr:hypothetical protein [Geodermatophilus sp. DSM 44513]WNV74293.1 hypothetical protein RTG05_14990 [Geodermatophilus sp. DSM 44513]